MEGANKVKKKPPLWMCQRHLDLDTFFSGNLEKKEAPEIQPEDVNWLPPGERCLSPHVQPPVRGVFTCLRDNVSAFEIMFPSQHLPLDNTEWINRLTPPSRFGLCSSAGLFPDPKTKAKRSSRLWVCVIHRWKNHFLHFPVYVYRCETMCLIHFCWCRINVSCKKCVIFMS